MSAHGVDRTGAASGSGAALNPIDQTMIDAKGDLIAGTAADAAARLAVGANDTLLVADSAQTTGMKWSDTVAAKQGAVTASGITQTTARLLGRTTASTGAIEEINVAASLTLSAGSLSGTQASTSQAGVAEWATQAEYDAGTASRIATTDLNAISLATPVASTSGTAVNFTSLPTGLRRITVHFNGVSTNGTSPLILQIGPSGGIESTGYIGAITRITTAAAVASASSTSGFSLTSATIAAGVYSGHVDIVLMNSSTNTWTLAGGLGDSATPEAWPAFGRKALAGVLSQLRITTGGGTDAFDAGEINITYER